MILRPIRIDTGDHRPDREIEFVLEYFECLDGLLGIEQLVYK